VNIEDFVKYGGLELILSYYTLPMLPFDFSISNAFDSLSYVFRMLAEVYPLRVAMCIADKVRETSAFVSDTPNEKSLVYEHTGKLYSIIIQYVTNS
jgi:E3 ubiquitin-protein ligase HUWE1